MRLKGCRAALEFFGVGAVVTIVNSSFRFKHLLLRRRAETAGQECCLSLSLCLFLSLCLSLSLSLCLSVSFSVSLSVCVCDWVFVLLLFTV